MLLNDPMFLIAAVASLAVLAILIFGVATFARGGEFNRRNANRIMRWRLGAQFVAVILILAFAYFGSRS
jgi:hypothetical protein